MTAWIYFAFVLTQAGNSIIGAQEMVKKIYFPRLIIPLSKAVVGFVDFIISFAILLLLMLYFRIAPSASIVYLPVFVFLTILSALSVGIWLSALTIRYRDFQHIIPFLVQFGLYVTPIAYPVEIVVKNLPAWGTVLYYLNPMAGVVEGFRWSVLNDTPFNLFSLISFAVVIVLFLSGILYFKRTERIMADIV